MNKEEIISSGLLELYATGLATEFERSQVLDAISQHDEVADELTRIEKSLELYAFTLGVPPAERAKTELINNLFTTSSAPVLDLPRHTNTPVYSISPVWKWVAAASIILLIGSAILNMKYYSEAQTNLTAKLEAENSLAIKEQQVDQMNQNINVIQSKYSEPVALHGLPAAPEAAAKIFWMKNTGDVYVDASNLPAAPMGKQYQLWAIVDGKPVDGGMILKSKKGNIYEIQKMKSFGSAQAFAITLETEGGNPTPKGEMYVMGEL